MCVNKIFYHCLIYRPNTGEPEDASMPAQIASEPELLARVLYEQSPIVNVIGISIMLFMYLFYYNADRVKYCTKWF